MTWIVLDPETKNTIDMAVHAILVPGGARGKVLYFGGYFVNDTHTYDIETETIDPAPPLQDYNLFCAGHSILADGRVLVAGGQLELYDEQGNPIPAPEPPDMPDEEDHAHPHYNMSWGGERHCSIYLPTTGAWVRVSDLNPDPAGNPNSGGRWYPTLCTLPNGEVLAVGGHPDVRELYPPAPNQRHNNNTPERYNPGTDTWTLLASDPPAENQKTANDTAWGFDFHRTHLLPSGLVFFSSPVRGSNRFYDPYKGRFVEDADHVVDLPPVNHNDEHEHHRDGIYHSVFAGFTSVLLPLLHQEGFRPRVLLMGGANAKRIDLGNPAAAQWQNTVKRDWAGDPPARLFVTPVLLPTGEVFFAGGTAAILEGEDAQALCVLPGETYDPGIDWGAGSYSQPEGWTTTPDQAAVGRHYHSVAVLLPDGAVWTAGSNGPTDAAINPGGRELRIEIYRPDYFDDQNARPVVSNAPKNIGYAYTFRFDTTQADSISRVALVRCGTVTHGFNMDQRYVSVDFEVVDANTIEVLVPADEAAIPPGRYMLWVVNAQNLPCRWAPFIRISKQKSYITADFSTFAKSEIDALGTPANFDNAAYVVYDGFLPDEATTPTHSLVWEDDQNAAVPGVGVEFGAPKYEGGFENKDTAQRVVYPCRITFTSDAAFDTFSEADAFRNMVLKTKMGGNFPASVTLTLSRKLNPRMRDGDPHWLSIDLRAFSLKPQDTPYAGLAHGSGGDAPFDYIQELLKRFNDWAAEHPNEPHPFDSLPTDQETNQLPLYSHDGDGNPLYNYAVARVRFRAPAETEAANVRVFFRLWTTGWSALEYHTDQSYRTHDINDGANAIALLGLTGQEINNVPCFAEPREANMEDQEDLTNRRKLVGGGADEVFTYFGCWLDLNREDKRFPLAPGNNNGPFGGELKSIQELMRGLHQCLVAEIHYVPDDKIPDGATPASSDSLAQRNLLLDASDNPGGFSTHLVHHTFEIKPSPFRLQTPHDEAGNRLVAGVASGRFHADELVIDWGNLPRTAQATLYMPMADADTVIRYAAQRQSPGNLSKVDEHTLLCKVTDVGFIPVPGPFPTAIPALLTVQLPPDITKGQKFTVVVRQIDGRKFRVLGATQFDIHVRTADEIRPRLERNLSVLKHVASTIPADNRWHPVFVRYLDQLSDRVRGMGGRPEEIGPSPRGDGGAAATRLCCTLQRLLSLLVAAAVVLLGVGYATGSAPLVAAGAVFLAAAVFVAFYLARRCRPAACALLVGALAGVALGTLVLGVLVALGVGGAGLIGVLAALAVLGGLLIVLAVLGRCCGRC